jgi:methylmalonyl-CoA carboxyltransferase 5S subunit
VAGKFFAQRYEGPKNVGKAPAKTAPAAAAAKPGDGPASITGPVTYEVRVGDKSHKVTVTPA